MGSSLKYFSLFSGIGGFEYGISKSTKKLKCVGCSEIDRFAESIYKKHFPKHTNFGDVKSIQTSELPKFDLLIGGFPCQSFSVAGTRKGFDDVRGTLFFEIARILDECRPKYFLLENVKNLIHHDKGNTFRTILGTLSELGYVLEWETYNSRDYGVNQNRERIFIKGYLRDVCLDDIFNQKRNETVSEHLKKQEHDSCKHFMKVTGCLYMTTTVCGDSFALNTKHRRRPLAKKQDNYVLDNGRIRVLTPVECERLQGFPDDWTKYGADGMLISDTQRYKCLGNAVTTTVVTNIIDKFEAIK